MYKRKIELDSTQSCINKKYKLHECIFNQMRFDKWSEKDCEHLINVFVFDYYAYWLDENQDPNEYWIAIEYAVDFIRNIITLVSSYYLYRLDTDKKPNAYGVIIKNIIRSMSKQVAHK